MELASLILLSLALGVAAWLFFMWSVKSGQYDDPEGPKYRMLDDEDDAAHAGRGPGARNGPSANDRGTGPTRPS